jgi:hypothetical protein
MVELAETFSITHGGPLHWLWLDSAMPGERQLLYAELYLLLVRGFHCLYFRNGTPGVRHQIKFTFVRDFAAVNCGVVARSGRVNAPAGTTWRG